MNTKRRHVPACSGRAVRAAGAAGRVVVLAMACGCLALSTASAAPVSTNDFLVRSWSKREGLPHNTVHAIHQTRDGYLWVATRAGLARFDGVHFTVFKQSNTPTMPSDDCHRLAEDPAGNLWIATSGGLVGFRAGTMTQYQTEDLFLTGNVGHLVVSQDGSLWVSTGGRLDNYRDGRFTRFPDPDQNLRSWIFSLYEGRDGRLWAGLARGLFQLDPATGEITGQRGLPAGEVRVLHEDKHGTLWAVADAGLFRRVGDRWQMVRSQRPDVVFLGAVLLTDGAGRLWAGSPDPGIDCYSDGVLAHLDIPGAPTDDVVLCAHVDREGSLWLGLERSGLHQWRPRRVQVVSAAEGLPHAQTWAILEAHDQRLWVATDQGVGVVHAGQAKALHAAGGLSAPAVRALAEDGRQRIWIGTGAGLDVWVGDTLHRHRFAGEYFNTKVRALWAGLNDRLWVGTLKGLHCLDLATFEPAAIPPPDGSRPAHPQPFSALRPHLSLTTTNGLVPDDVRALVEDPEGTLWIGTYGGGLFRFRSGILEPFTTRDGVASDHVYAFLVSDGGTLWVATERGLSRLQAGRFTNYGAREGLWDGAVNAILDDLAGHLWLSSDGGVARVRKSDLLAVAEGRRTTVTPVFYGETEGMPNPETNGQKSQPAGIRTRDGRLWFATMNGVVAFDPAALPDTTNAPMVIIERIRANGDVVFDNAGTAREPRAAPERRLGGIGTLAFLPPGSAHFLEIHYTATTFVAAEEVRFHHQLEGVDPDWIDAGNLRAAAYANLRPGRYRFRVRATNKYGVASAEPAAFAFVLEPHYHETTWFYGLCGVFTLLLAWWGVRLRLRYAARVHALAQAQALVDDRARISRDLHDGLGAQLTRLTLLAELSSVSGSDPTAAPSRLPQLTALARETARSLREIIWANHPGDDTLDGLYARICQYAEEALQPADVACRFEPPDRLPPRSVTPRIRHHVFLMAKEALTNVLKHARADEVHIGMTLRDSTVHLSIRDNGCGLHPHAARGGGRGLAHLQERASLIGGRLHIQSPVAPVPSDTLPSAARGTTITIEFPLDAAPGP